MSDINERCLEIFPGWLEQLGNDVKVIKDALDSDLERDVKKTLAGGINYLFKSLDLIPDGIDDIGYLDDAFVIRLTARLACDAGIDNLSDEQKSSLGKIADEISLVKELLGDDLYLRFENYTKLLADGSARGRSVDEILDEQDVAVEFTQEVNGFVSGYTAPSFSKDEKNIIKLVSFMDAKLPK